MIEYWFNRSGVLTGWKTGISKYQNKKHKERVFCNKFKVFRKNDGFHQDERPPSKDLQVSKETYYMFYSFADQSFV